MEEKYEHEKQTLQTVKWKAYDSHRHAMNLDPEWIELMREAQNVGLSTADIRSFIEHTCHTEPSHK